MANNWETLVKDKQARQKESIPKDWLVSIPPKDRLNVLDFPRQSGLLTQFELEITESNVGVLLPKLASGEWSSVDVTRAFYKRAIIAHQVVNCLTEIFVDKALERAAYLDEQLKTTGKPVGPLHGLPISLKDQLSIKGLETTMGYASWVGKYAEKDAVLTQILYELGAVPFVRTNVPQTLMWPETYNYVFGRTLNPANRSLTPGGSSGGEGALIAMRGSVLGVGSDTGGSIRIPAGFNGLYGLRPSYYRIPYRGVVTPLDGEVTHPCVLGPLSTSLEGVRTFMKAVVDAKPWTKDPLVINKPWDQAAYELIGHGGGKQLVFGIIWHDGNVVPHPPVTRALEMTKKALICAGHKVVDWIPLNHTEICASSRNIWTAGLFQDFNTTTADSGEPIISTMAINPPATDRTVGIYEMSKPGTSAYQFWQVQKERLNIRGEYLDEWEASKEITGTGRPIDALISPIAPYTATPHGRNNSADYTMLWNNLDYPALAFPVTNLDQELDKVEARTSFLSEEDRLVNEFYSPEVFTGAPVGLQVVGRTMEEEALIGMAEIIDRALNMSNK